MIVIATIIVPPWLEIRIKDQIAAATTPASIGFGARVITEPRLPNDAVLTSGKALVHGSEEYERLLAEALADPQPAVQP